MVQHTILFQPTLYPSRCTSSVLSNIIVFFSKSFERRFHCHHTSNVSSGNMMCIFLGLAGVVSLSIYALWLALSAWKTARYALRLGCKPAPMHPSMDPWGISDLLEIWQADRKGCVLGAIYQRVERTSAQEGRRVSTFSIRQIGEKNLFTCDPINIKTVLATKFKDFDLGGAKIKGIRPLLGNGIVSLFLNRESQRRLKENTARFRPRGLDLCEEALATPLRPGTHQPP